MDSQEMLWIRQEIDIVRWASKTGIREVPENGFVCRKIPFDNSLFSM